MKSHLVLLLALPALACASDVGAHHSLAETVEIYRQTSGTKAIAVAADARGKRAWGWTQAPLQGMANDGAMESCQKNASRLGVQARCYLLAEGDEPAAATEQGCREEKIPEPRCRVQARYAPRG